MKLFYTESKPPENLQHIFTEIAKFEVKEKRKLNFQLLFSPTSSLLVIYNGNTGLYSSKIAGYRNIQLKINLSENSVLYDFKFKSEIFYLLNKGEIEKFKNKCVSFAKLKFEKGVQTENEILEIVSLYFNGFEITAGGIKKYILDSIESIYSGKGIFKPDEIINTAGISVRQFQRDFKKVTGFSPKEFTSIVRINFLSNELVKDNVSLRDIFFNFGFYDQSHFNKEFKKFAGTNPSLFESRQKLIKYLNLLK